MGTLNIVKEDTAMKYDDLIQELNTWEYDEKIYREYYFMKKLRRIFRDLQQDIRTIKKKLSGHRIRKK